MLIGSQTSRDTWVGIAIMLPGLALLTLGDFVAPNYGDALVLSGAIFWAAHVVLIGVLAPRHNVIALAFVQFLTASVLSFVIAAFTESWTFEQVKAAWLPLAFVGVMSTGIAYTLQIVGQKTAPVAHAAILLSLETVFAVFFGYLLMGETMSAQALFGCFVMLAGMLISQLGLNRIRQLLGKKAPVNV